MERVTETEPPQDDVSPLMPVGVMVGPAAPLRKAENSRARARSAARRVRPVRRRRKAAGPGRPPAPQPPDRPSGPSDRAPRSAGP